MDLPPPFDFTFGTTCLSPLREDAEDGEGFDRPGSPFTTIELLPFVDAQGFPLQQPVPVDFSFGLVDLMPPEALEEHRLQSAARALAGVEPPSPPPSPFVTLEVGTKGDDDGEGVQSPTIKPPKKRKASRDEGRPPKKMRSTQPPPSVAHSDGSVKERVITTPPPVLPSSTRSRESSQSVDADVRRRANHNAIEKRRRAQAKVVMDELQQAVRPLAAVTKPSKTEILQAATAYIRELEAQVAQLQRMQRGMTAIDTTGSFLPSYQPPAALGNGAAKDEDSGGK